MANARRTALRAACLGLTAALAATVAQPAHAVEGGASLYLLGSGGPGAALMPPLQGIFFDNILYHYSGDASGGRQVLNGNVVLDLDAKITADFASVLWVPSTNFLGGTVGLGGILAGSQIDVGVSGVLTGPRGRQFAAGTSDQADVIADPVLLGQIGWTLGPKLHLAGSTAVNVPIGQYRKDQLANLAFHRWIVDTSMAMTWRDPRWDLSSKAGLTFNGTNDYTDYDSGTEFHVEGSIEYIFSKAFSAGVQAYHYQQVSDDSGAGALLGPNRGRVTGVGGTVAYNFQVGKAPVTARVRLLDELAANRRLEGTSLWFDVSMPLSVKLPPH